MSYIAKPGTKLAKVVPVNLICPSDKSRRRIKCVADLGFRGDPDRSQFGAIGRSSACAI
jgi:hypothetical protein